ncbi:MAG: hypothetical protein ACYDDA_05270 [Acidiferrobacteraceae bacterium]
MRVSRISRKKMMAVEAAADTLLDHLRALVVIPAQNRTREIVLTEDELIAVLRLDRALYNAYRATIPAKDRKKWPPYPVLVPSRNRKPR